MTAAQGRPWRRIFLPTAGLRRHFATVPQRRGRWARDAEQADGKADVLLWNGSGFSLVEVMVVLFLVALIAAVTVPATGRFFDSLAGRRKEGAILANFRYARLMAIESGRQITATVGEEGRELRFEGGLQETRDLGFTDEEVLSMEPGAVVFYPEGMATVATVTFSGGRRTASWWIEPLTGLPVAVPVEPR